MMGMYFISLAMGNLFAGLMAGGMSTEDGGMVAMFTNMFIVCLIAGSLLILLKGFINRLMRQAA